jgi:hypothetical protein
MSAAPALFLGSQGVVMDPITTEFFILAVPPLVAALVGTGLAVRGRRKAGTAFAVGLIGALLVGLVVSTILGLMDMPAPRLPAWLAVAGWAAWPVLELPLLAGMSVLVGGLSALVVARRNRSSQPSAGWTFLSAYALLAVVLAAIAWPGWLYWSRNPVDPLMTRIQDAQREVADLKSSDAATRRQAAQALAHLGRDARGTMQVRSANTVVVPALIPLLKDPDDSVRTEAAKGFQEVGAAGPEAEPRLRELAKDSDDRVRAAATQALQQVTEARAIDHLRGIGGKVFGGEYLIDGPTTAVELDWLKLTDADLEALKAFPHLRRVSLMKAQLGDTALAAAAGCPELEVLDLYGTPTSDAGVALLRPMTVLKNLNLGETKITNASLKGLSQLPNLEVLYLDNTAVTDAGLKDLGGAQHLRTLYVRKSKVTVQGIKQLKALLPKVNAVRDTGMAGGMGALKKGGGGKGGKKMN